MTTEQKKEEDYCGCMGEEGSGVCIECFQQCDDSNVDVNEWNGVKANPVEPPNVDGHYIVYGEWKIYDDDGVCGTKNDEYTEFKNCDDAVVEYNKMVKDNENEMRDDYDLIYLDYIDEDGDADNRQCWERPVLIE